MAPYLRILVVAFRKPTLVGGLLATAWAFRARHWYRSFPFLPIPPGEYLRWRMETAYGDPGALPSPEELERFVRWAGRMRRLM